MFLLSRVHVHYTCLVVYHVVDNKHLPWKWMPFPASLSGVLTVSCASFTCHNFLYYRSVIYCPYDSYTLQQMFGM